MPTRMSQEFVVAFVQECAANGLTKEATAELLQFQSVVHVANHSAEFAEGFEKIAAQVPGGLRPLAREGYLSKEAGSKMQALQGLFNAGSGVVRAFGAPLLDAAKRTLATTARNVRGNPLTAAGVSAGLGAGGAYGLSKLFGGSDHDVTHDVPFLSGTGYNPTTAGQQYNAMKDAYSTGIADLSQKLDGSAARRKTLEEAVARHDVSSPMALVELQRLNKEHEEATKVREDYMKKYRESADSAESRAKDLEAKRQSLIAAQDDWLHMPQRAWYRLTNRDPKEVYNAKLREVEGPLEQATTTQRLSNDLARRLDIGYTGKNQLVNRTPQEAVRNFFPTSGN